MNAALVAATVLVVSQPVLVLVSGTVIPAVAAAVTKDLTGWVQVALLAVLSAIAGVASQAIGGSGAFPVGPTIMTIVSTAVVAFAAHYGYSVSGLLGSISRATAGFGIGPDNGQHAAAGPPGTTWVKDPRQPSPTP